MSDDKTTPRPWVVQPSTWKSTTSDYQLTTCGIEQDSAVFGDDAFAIVYASRLGQINPADATLIVRAVNAHEDLVAALQLAAPHVCSLLCPSVKKTGTEWTHSTTCAAITAALAKADKS